MSKEGEEILLDQIERIGEDDEYPYHVYLTQMLAWVRKWLVEPKDRLGTLEQMNELAEEARINHPTSRRIERIAGAVRAEYLELAILVK